MRGTVRPDRSLRALPAFLIAGWLLAALAVPVWAQAEEEKAGLAHYDEAVDEAIERGLAYLADKQDDDGSFPSGWGKNTGITSLCVMAFLAKGYTPGDHEYGQVIDKGIDFVLASRKPNDMLVGPGPSHGPMYGHTIATLMLSEVSGMVDPERQKAISEVLPKALRVILAAQQVPKLERYQGGWRYQSNSTDSDISCTGWPLMSLRSARNNGASVPKEAIEYALEFVMRCRTSDGGFAYQPGGGPGVARTGVALLCFELCGLHRDEVALAAGDWILGHLQRSPNESYFYYGLYYCAQGMYQLGDDYWERYATHMYDMMLKLQRQDGSWPAGSEKREGECYATAMAALAFSVPCCQLPIYQR